MTTISGRARERWWLTVTLMLPVVALLLVLASCSASGARAAAEASTGGNAQRGRVAMTNYGCGACHTVGGVRSAHGQVGPPLDGVGERSIIAGEAANTPENMVRWIRDPQSIEPNTAMPNLGVDERTARDMAAYLYSRR